MIDHLLQIGAGGIFAVLVLREVFRFLKDWKFARANGERRNNNPGHLDQIAGDVKEIRDLTLLHCQAAERAFEQIEELSKK